MTNPFIPNSAPIPNILFDYWMAQLSPAEFKVLMAIARKTYGWQKQKDRISIRQLTELTGLHKSNVIKATESLISLGLVLKFKSKDEYGDRPNEYEINIDNEEGGISNNGGGSRVERQEGVAQNDTPRVAQNDTQKTLYTKDTIQNKNIAQSTHPATPIRAKEPQIAFSFPDRKFEHISNADIKSWKELYPDLNVNRELQRMVEWILANPTKAKSKKLWRKFILTWLQNENEKQTNKAIYKQTRKNEVLERHTGFNRDNSPRDPRKTIDLNNLPDDFDPNDPFGLKK